MQPASTDVTFSPVKLGLVYQPKKICPSLTGATKLIAVPTTPFDTTYSLVDEVIVEENKLYYYKSQIFQLVDSNMSVEEVNLEIDMLLRNYTEDESTQAGELPIIVAITGIAKATNTLWRQEWNPTYHPFIPDDLQYTAADTASTDQEEEDLKELAIADI